jgi:molybdopterin converting factor subunit 1
MAPSCDGELIVTVQVRLFAAMAQQARTGVLTVDLPEGSAVGAVQSELRRRHPRMAWPPGTMLAVNQEYAGEGTLLKPGDEVAVIPPVSGG